MFTVVTWITMTTIPQQPKRILDDSVIRATGYLIDGANMIPPPPSRVKQIANAGHVWRMSTRDSANSRDRERLGRVRYFHVLLSNVKWQRETGSGDKGYREIRPRVAIQQECRIKWPSEKSNLKNRIKSSLRCLTVMFLSISHFVYYLTLMFTLNCHPVEQIKGKNNDAC